MRTAVDMPDEVAETARRAFAAGAWPSMIPALVEQRHGRRPDGGRWTRTDVVRLLAPPRPVMAGRTRPAIEEPAETPLPDPAEACAAGSGIAPAVMVVLGGLAAGVTFALLRRG